MAKRSTRKRTARPATPLAAARAQIAELKRKLQKADEYRLVLDAASDPVFSLTPDGHYTNANQALADAFGVPLSEIIGKGIRDFFPKEEADGRLAALREVYRTGEEVIIEGAVPRANSYYQTAIKPVKDAAGKVASAVCISRDITGRRHAEEVLRESEERFRSLVDNSPDAIFVHLEGIIRYANTAMARLVGVDDLLGRPALDFVAPEFRDLVLQRRVQVKQTGVPLPIVELAWLRRDGSRVSVESSSMSTRFAGKLAQLVLTRDITDRKRAEETLRQSEERFNVFMQNNPAAAWIIDAEGRFVFLNQSYRRMFAVGDGEIVGRRIADLYPKEIADEYIAYNRRTLQQGRAVESIEPGLRPDRTNGRYLVIKFPLGGVSGEQMLGGIAIDITESEQAKQALRASEERYRSMVEWLPEAAIVHRGGRLIYVNPSAVKLFGATSANDLLGKSILDLIHPDYHERVLALVKAADEQRQLSAPMEVQKCLRLDGTPVEVESQRRSISYDGEPAMFVVIRDVSARMRAEAEKSRLEAQLQQAQKMDSVGRLAGGVAHDFNNMLSVILGHAEMALEQMGPSLPARSHLGEIQEAARRSADLTRQLLAFARKQTVAPKVIDLNATITGMLQMLRRLIGEDLDLRWQPSAEVWPVKVDPSQIDQILANLCVNARDAIAGNGRVTIETENCTFDEAYCAAHAGYVAGDYVHLAVSDDGSGMDEATLAHLFEPFFTTKGVGRGTGLGLATVYGIVKQNGGLISVYSEPGSGTTFRLHFPRYTGKERDAAPPAAEGSLVRGHETVLLVEDEPSILRMSKRMLELLGYAAIAASSPSEAIRLAREHTGRIDLLMTDVVMPEMNGRVLAEKLQSSLPGLKLLFMSGYTANVIAHHGVLDERVNFINKPFSVSELSAKLRAVLDGPPAAS